MLALLVTPVTLLALRFMEHESWTIALIASGGVALILISWAVWDHLMNGKAIEMTDERLSLPALLGEAETIEWSWIEAYKRSFDFTRGGGPDHFIEITYLGGRTRKIYKHNLAADADYDVLESAIASAVDKRK